MYLLLFSWFKNFILIGAVGGLMMQPDDAKNVRGWMQQQLKKFNWKQRKCPCSLVTPVQCCLASAILHCNSHPGHCVLLWARSLCLLLCGSAIHSVSCCWRSPNQLRVHFVCWYFTCLQPQFSLTKSKTKTFP